MSSFPPLPFEEGEEEHGYNTGESVCKGADTDFRDWWGTRAKVILKLREHRSGLSPRIVNLRGDTERKPAGERNAVQIHESLSPLDTRLSLLPLAAKPDLLLLRVWHYPNMFYVLCSVYYPFQEYFKPVSFTVKPNLFSVKRISGMCKQEGFCWEF